MKTNVRGLHEPARSFAEACRQSIDMIDEYLAVERNEAIRGKLIARQDSLTMMLMRRAVR